MEGEWHPQPSSLDPNASYQGRVAGGCGRPCFCCPQVPAPDSTSKAVPRSLGIGERRLLVAMCLPLTPTYNLNLRPEGLDGVARRDGQTQRSFLFPQQLVAIYHSAKPTTQWPQGEALHPLPAQVCSVYGLLPWASCWKSQAVSCLRHKVSKNSASVHRSWPISRD